MSWWMIQLDVETMEMIRDEDFLEKRMKLDLKEDNKLSLRIQSPCQMMIGVCNHLLRKVFRFHYQSQKVIGSPGYDIYDGNMVFCKVVFHTSLCMNTVYMSFEVF